MTDGSSRISTVIMFQISHTYKFCAGLSGRREMNDVPSGVNAITLNIVDENNGYQEEAAVVAGFFSFKFDNYTNPSI